MSRTLLLALCKRVLKTLVGITGAFWFGFVKGFTNNGVFGFKCVKKLVGMKKKLIFETKQNEMF